MRFFQEKNEKENQKRRVTKKNEKLFFKTQEKDKNTDKQNVKKVPSKKRK